jgi:NAD(P)-dependent dehydrogenase (short-subunit alcohol dehydrogenase family)
VTALARELGARAVALQLDLANVGAFGEFIGHVRAALDGLGANRFDYLVNNAGMSHHNAFEETTEVELDALYNVHFKGVFFLTQKLLALINDGGRIVNLSSGLRMTFPGSASYASMKGAIEVLTRYLAAVNAVAPGAIATDFSGGLVRDNPEINRRVADMTALGRAGLPDDVGPMVASLLADDNRWINAQRVEVSGGMAL